MPQPIIFTQEIATALSRVLADIQADKLFLLTDHHTYTLCQPLIASVCADFSIQPISIPAGDDAKTLTSLSHVWQTLSEDGASRKSLLINLGGGMITDLGGFAAASFKRGMPFINIPTTLLGAIDAAVGGKTGINFNGLKNEIGAFAPAQSVIISPVFFKTLDAPNMLSGFAEMIKHGLIDSPDHLQSLLEFDLSQDNPALLLDLMKRSVAYKSAIVSQDPYEKGIRKALNFGHTVAHAFESLALDRREPILHGYAVAWGMVCELILSHRQCGFPLQMLKKIASFVQMHYGIFPFTCKSYDQLYSYMEHDKKNEGGKINFTLLADVGHIQINQQASKEDLFAMFDIFRELFGI